MRKRNVVFQFLLQSWYGLVFFAKAMFSSKNKNDMDDGKKNDSISKMDDNMGSSKSSDPDSASDPDSERNEHSDTGKYPKVYVFCWDECVCAWRGVIWRIIQSVST